MKGQNPTDPDAVSTLSTNIALPEINVETTTPLNITEANTTGTPPQVVHRGLGPASTSN